MESQTDDQPEHNQEFFEAIKIIPLGKAVRKQQLDTVKVVSTDDNSTTDPQEIVKDPSVNKSEKASEQTQLTSVDNFKKSGVKPIKVTAEVHRSIDDDPPTVQETERRARTHDTAYQIILPSGLTSEKVTAEIQIEEKIGEETLETYWVPADVVIEPSMQRKSPSLTQCKPKLRNNNKDQIKLSHKMQKPKFFKKKRLTTNWRAGKLNIFTLINCQRLMVNIVHLNDLFCSI